MSEGNAYLIDYELLKHDDSVINRRRVKQQSSSNGPFVSGSAEKIDIYLDSSDEWSDMSSIGFLFSMSATGTSLTHASFCDWCASSWIKQITISTRAGVQIGQPMTNYNRYFRANMELKSNTDLNASYLNVLEGANAFGTASGVASIDAKQYFHRPMGHIFTGKYFPIHLINGLKISITLETVAPVVRYASGSAPSYTISDFYVVYDAVRMSPEIDNALAENIKNGLGVEVNYQSYQSIPYTISDSTTQNRDLGIFQGRIKNILAYQQVASTSTVLDLLGIADLNDLSSYRFKIGGNKYLTENSISVSTANISEYLFELLKSQNMNVDLYKYGDLTAAQLIGSTDSQSANRFYIGQKVERGNNPLLLSSLRDKSNNKLDIELSFSSAPASAGAIMYVFVNLDKQLKFSSQRQIIEPDFSDLGNINQ